jgi:hypothetical protein
MSETCKCISFKTLPEIIHMNAMWFNTDLNGQSLGKMEVHKIDQISDN